MYRRGQISYAQYLECDANAWETYENTSKYANGSNKDYIEEQRKAAEQERERMRQEAQAIEDELTTAGINLGGFDWENMSLHQKLKLLRHIKKICEDYGLGTEYWDRDAAQNAVDGLKPQSTEEGKFDLFGMFDKIMKYIQNNIISPIINAINIVSSNLEILFDFFKALFERGGGSVNGIFFTSSVIIGMLLNGEFLTIGLTSFVGTSDLIFTLQFSPAFLGSVATLNKWLPWISFTTDIIGNLLSGYSLFRSLLVPSITLLVQLAVNIFVPIDPITKFLVNTLIGWILPPITNYIFDLIGVM